MLLRFKGERAYSNVTKPLRDDLTDADHFEKSRVWKCGIVFYLNVI